jgi:hypothetical protein
VTKCRKRYTVREVLRDGRHGYYHRGVSVIGVCDLFIAGQKVCQIDGLQVCERVTRK